MLVNGKAFAGTIDYQLSDDKWQACTGIIDLTCLTKFRPVEDFPHARFAYKILLTLHGYNLFCFLTGTYVTVVGGQLDMFDGLSIIITLNDFKRNPILNWLFKKFSTLQPFILQ